MHQPIKSTVKLTLGDFAPAFVEYSEKVLFGDLWRREELSLRDRSMITVSALVSAGSLNQLEYHLHLAKENGVMKEELIEVITHLSFYIGWPKAASALEAAKHIQEDK
ncbi:MULTISPECIES: carboxymuconolactone decarboxylase family protein [Bacillus]|uniref:carboxymuconolactone decarboxylase family protein n=1 Tax=Bacillus TaxID=1386 RepID=UPI000D041E96|nr:MULTISPECIES: carboxymuconolactone decarboxylase family protein [Bacillus]PRS78724.1 carboxymuconolactone decarboxylase family protein [Bacillus sp. CJCL2]PRS82395.1 carboxymuconolactone decarboxylase family protein [Bacillus sp. YBWC18]